MIKTDICKCGDKLPTRNARGNGIGACIAVPKECSGIRYERYIDRTTGIITLIPVKDRAEPRVEKPEEDHEN